MFSQGRSLGVRARSEQRQYLAVGEARSDFTTVEEDPEQSRPSVRQAVQQASRLLELVLQQRARATGFVDPRSIRLNRTSRLRKLTSGAVRFA